MALSSSTMILTYLSMFCLILLGIIVMFFKAIKEAYLWKYKRTDYIRAIIIYKDKILIDKPIKVKGQVDFKEGERTYTIDHSCVYLTNGKTPTLIYEADDPQPKNVLSEVVQQLLKCPSCNDDIELTFKKPVFPSGEELDNMMMRAKSAGLIKGLMKELPRLIKLLYICIGVGVIAAGGSYLLYKELPNKIAEILVPKLEGIIRGVIVR